MADLAILALDERELYPACRNVCAEPYWRVTRPEPIGFGGDFYLARLGAIPLDVNAFSEFADSFFGDLPIHLSQIGTRVLVFRVEQLFDEFPVIGE